MPSARALAIRASLGALAQARSTFQVRRLSAEQASGIMIDWRKADGTKDHPVWASAPIETEPRKYDLVVVLTLNPIRDESIILSRPGLPSLSWAATRRTQPRRVAIRLRSLSCRTCRLPWGDDILQMTVCLRDGKEAAELLKAIYPDEAKNAELDITAKFKVR